MKRIGCFISKYGKSCLVIKSEKELNFKKPNTFLNINVLDKNMDVIGKIISIFGSEKQLYFLVYLLKKESALRYLDDIDNKNKLYIKNLTS